MPYFNEITIAAVLAAGILIYLIRPKHKEKKLMLISKYRRVRSKSLMLQDLLSSHILQNDSDSEDLRPGVTYGEFMRELKKMHSYYLSEKTYIKLKNSNNIFFLKKTDRILDEQEDQLNDIEKELLVIAS